MPLYRTRQGFVTHSDAIAVIPAVPSRREAESAYIRLASHLPEPMTERFDKELQVLRDFVLSR